MSPRLKVFGCVPLPISADDLTLPAFIGLVLRFPALVAIVAILAVAASASPPVAQTLDLVFLAGTAGVCLASHLLFFVLFKVSGRGNLLEPEKRHRPSVLVYHLLAVCYVVELGFGALGAACLHMNGPDSPLLVVEALAVAGIFFDIACLGVLISVLAMFSRGKRPQKLDALGYSNFVFGALKGMSYAMCGLFGSLPKSAMNNELAWSEISRVFHAFLKDSFMEFTVMDMLTALVLVRIEQREVEQAKVDVALPPVAPAKAKSVVRLKSQAIGTKNVEAKQMLALFDEFAPYMTGIYGWKLLAIGNLGDFLRAYPKALWKHLFGDGTDVEYSIFQHRIGGAVDHTKRQIVFSSFTSYLEQAVPYTITVDHEKKAVVITVRGTMSVSDIALDLMCEPMAMKHAEANWGVKHGSQHYAHGGMLKVASRIRADIDKQQILHRLFKAKPQSSSVKEAVEITAEDRESFLKAMSRHHVTEDLMYQSNCFVNNRELDRLDCSAYRLICCGHSLGSCMSSILTVLLHDEFPQIQCLGYSAVSSIFSKELAEECGEYVYSITQGKDVFGRLNWRSMADLRENVLDKIRLCKVNKFTVLTSFFRPQSRLSDYLYAQDEAPATPERQRVEGWIRRFRQETDHPEQFEGSLAIQRIPMFMPGKIFYLEKLHTEVVGRRRVLRCCTREKQSTYQATRVMDRSKMRELHITSRLILDHMPDTLAYNIKHCLKGYDQGELWNAEA